MQQAGYREEELVSNRTAVLLWGGSEEDRCAWAREAAAHLGEEGLVEVRSEVELPPALERTRGVVLVKDVLAFGVEAQARLMQCLQREERPKLVIASSLPPATAWAEGKLRDDLAFRLQRSRVDLSGPGLRDAIRARRKKVKPAKPAKQKARR